MFQMPCWWNPLRTRAIPERLRGVFMTRRYTNTRLPYLTLLCCRMQIREKIFVPQLISYSMHRQPESADKLLVKFNLSHKLQLLNVQHNFCSVMCYIVLIWTLILTLENNVVTLLFNRPKPVHYTLSDNINAYIRICIQQIWNVKIPIQRMRILTSFVTSLQIS